MKSKIPYILFLLILLTYRPLTAQRDYEKYQSAIEAIKSGQEDFAFIELLSISRDKPQTRYRQDSLYACGEYYFFKLNYRQALNIFSEFIEDYPDSRIKPYALFYILKIAKSWRSASIVKMLENKIRDMKQVILIFKESNEYKYPYTSLFGRKYKLIYHVDRVEFNIDGKVLEQVFY
jgi:outer membrane protein assembly factor BamD (BamD/ComL family)